MAKALAQGIGNKVKHSLERAIALAPGHADARIALGAFHAEVIDKVGPLIGGMTYGAKKDVALRLFQEALQLHPESPLARTEYANARADEREPAHRSTNDSWLRVFGEFEIEAGQIVNRNNQLGPKELCGRGFDGNRRR